MLKFHHSGFIVKDIDSWEKGLLAEIKIADIYDPIQNARLSLYKQHGIDGFIELIQPLNNSAFTWNALLKYGNHFHHFCYSVSNLNEVDVILKQYKVIPIMMPVEAVLFHGKKIVFYYTRNKQVVEFLIEGNDS
jgi:hypothetical protein